MKRLVIAFIILLFASPCGGAVHYVEKNGSETSPFDTLTKAANTIQHVFDNIDLAPSDIVRVCAATVGGSVTYAEKVSWGANDDGDITGNVTLEGRAGDTVTIDGTDYGITGSEDYVTISNLNVIGCTNTGIYWNGGDHLTIENTTVTGSGAKNIATHNTTGDILLDNITATTTTTDDNREGGGVTDADSVTVRDSTVTGGQLNGILVFVQNSGTILIDSNTVNTNGHSGILIENCSGATVTISNNTNLSFLF